MKKELLKIALAGSILTAGGMTANVTAEASGHYEGALNATCEVYNVCKNTSVAIVKAIDKYNVQDMEYWNFYETSTKPLKKGQYYQLVYKGDYPFKAYLYKPTKAEKKALDKAYKKIKQKQKKHNFKIVNTGGTF